MCPFLPQLLVLHEACLTCPCGLVLVILQSCPFSSCLMAVVLVVTQYVHCLSNVNRMLVVVHRELGYHPIQQATIFGLITIPDHHVCHPSARMLQSSSLVAPQLWLVNTHSQVDS